MAKEKTKRATKTPTTELSTLWKNEFFNEWRSAGDVASEFARTGCHFGASSVSKALLRAPFITRRGKGVGLRYIQTYPFEK